MNNSEHLYILKPYTGRNSRLTCPACEKPHQFTRYINNESGEPLANNVGKCNRIDKCGYHYPPRQYFQDHNISYPDFQDNELPLSQSGLGGLPSPTISPRKAENKVNEPSYISQQIFKPSLQEYQNNNLVIYLHTLSNHEQVDNFVNLYNIGTSSRWNGGTTIFWQIDIEGKVRTGKLIKYDPTTGKRMKNLTNWVHAVLKVKDFNLKQCLFGEHLLNSFPEKTIGIVESEKTAIIASVFLPGILWLASGGAENLNKEKVRPLRKRKVILFPDASQKGLIYKKWKDKAEKFSFEISDFLELNASEEQKAEGVDIADFLKNEKKPIIENDIDIDIDPDPELLADEYNGITLQIPYNTPSPVAIKDSTIVNPPKFEGADLVIKSRVFTATNGDKVELVGLRDYGYCGDWKTHQSQKRECKACLLNCLHTIKINGKLQQREYTQLEVLLLY